MAVLKKVDASLIVAELRPARGVVEHRGRHELDDQLTVEAWVRSETSGLESFQVVASKWRPHGAMTADAFRAFDAGRTNGLESIGYFGAVFDGRYVYYSPEQKAGGSHGIALRFDTHRDFRDPASYEAFDAGNTDGLDTRGYYGAAFDGRHVIYIPRRGPTPQHIGHARLLRFDTHGAFDDPRSWSAFDGGMEQSHQGCAFDGQYVYCCPGSRKREDGGGSSGRVLRYNTQGDFKDRRSYEVFDAEHIDGLDPGNFDGGAFDGRYVYFVPLTQGITLRYDTQSPYSAAKSWEAFDARKLGMSKCVGAVFDGRYLYYVMYDNGMAVRFDTQGDFRDPVCWSNRDVSQTGGLDTRGFDGGCFDGRYVHYIPFTNDNTTFHANWLRYDATMAFDDSSAWTSLNVEDTDGLVARGYNGGAYDGRFLYCAPWRGQMGDDEHGPAESWGIHGRVLRFDSLGQNGSFSLRYCDYGHNGGLCAATPGPAFLVNTDGGARSVSAHRRVDPGWHYLAGVYDGQQLALYIDGELAASRTASGSIVTNDVPIAAGRINDGLGVFRGDIEYVRVMRAAASEQDIQTTYAELR